MNGERNHQKPVRSYGPFISRFCCWGFPFPVAQLHKTGRHREASGFRRHRARDTPKGKDPGPQLTLIFRNTRVFPVGAFVGSHARELFFLQSVEIGSQEGP